MPNTPSHPPIFNLGFRPFFSGACVFAVVSIGYWLSVYLFAAPLKVTGITAFQWHAHEMIYGYSLAVIAGFLLTAVKNWTGLQTPQGLPLAALFLLWVLARLTWLFGTSLIELAAWFDLTFVITLIVAISRPIIATRKWRQLAIISKLILLGIGNSIFYLGALGYIDSGVHLALYGGLYLVIGLILTIGRRIIPFFIERGVEGQVKLFNSPWLDGSSLIFFLTFFIAELFLQNDSLAELAAAMLALITAVRIVGWYTSGILQTPLLWSLFIALGFIDFGFILIAVRDWFSLSPFLATHAFGVGGVGVITMGMMARVSIGHTGRSLKTLPAVLPYCLGLLLVGTLIRVLLPLFFESFYTLWVALAGCCWLLGFGLFCTAYLPILSQERPDKKYG